MNLKEKLLSQNKFIDLNVSQEQINSIIENNISKTYGWMGIVLLVTFAIAYGVYYMVNQNMINVGQLFIGSIASSLLGFGIIIWMSFGWAKMKYNTLGALFLLFGVLEGFGLSIIFINYSLASVINIFLTTSIMFVLLCIAGYKFKIDTTKRGTILFVGVIALIIGFIINMFLHNSEFNIVLNAIGILIFSGFVIYDMAVLKENAVVNDSRIQIIMGLSLFLDFINIFIMMLNLFGDRD